MLLLVGAQMVGRGTWREREPIMGVWEQSPGGDQGAKSPEAESF